jgi:hypothetical protein
MWWEEPTMTKADLHRLIDELPATREEAAYRVLKCLWDEKRTELSEALLENPEDPLLLALAEAPEDDEPETPEEAEAVRLAKEESARGESVPLDEVWRELLGDS